jgi:hypothetical protein
MLSDVADMNTYNSFQVDLTKYQSAAGNESFASDENMAMLAAVRFEFPNVIVRSLSTAECGRS